MRCKNHDRGVGGGGGVQAQILGLILSRKLIIQGLFRVYINTGLAMDASYRRPFFQGQTSRDQIVKDPSMAG